MLQINEMSKQELSLFLSQNDVIANLETYLNEFWNIKVEPKDFKNYLNSYEEYDELSEEERSEINNKAESLKMLDDSFDSTGSKPTMN